VRDPFPPRPAAPAPQTSVVARLVDALFKFEPLFAMATKAAREKIVKRAEAIGIDWASTIAERERVDWAREAEAVVDPALAARLPEYWLVPFHAYKDGHK